MDGVRLEIRTATGTLLLTRDFEREMVRRLRDAGAADEDLARFQAVQHELVEELEAYARSLPPPKEV